MSCLDSGLLEKVRGYCTEYGVFPFRLSKSLIFFAPAVTYARCSPCKKLKHVRIPIKKYLNRCVSVQCASSFHTDVEIRSILHCCILPCLALSRLPNDCYFNTSFICYPWMCRLACSCWPLRRSIIIIVDLERNWCTRCITGCILSPVNKRVVKVYGRDYFWIAHVLIPPFSPKSIDIIIIVLLTEIWQKSPDPHIALPTTILDRI